MLMFPQSCDTILSYYLIEVFVGRRKKIVDSERLSVVMSKAQAEQIRRMAILLSRQEGRVVTVSEAIRSVLEAAYPIPHSQGKLFV